MKERSRRLKNVSLASTGVAMLALSSFLLLRRPDPLAAVPDGEELRVGWACHDCGHVEHLTPRQRVSLHMSEASATAASPAGATAAMVNDTETSASMREFVLRCPRCKAAAFRQAFVCTRCGEAFALTVKGITQKCPKCGFDPGSPSASERRSGSRPRPAPADESDRDAGP